MRPTLLAVTAAALLAGCNQKSVSLTNASPEEVAKAAVESGAVTLKPGKWVTTGETTLFEVPGMPPEMAARMKAMAPKTVEVSYCLSPEDVSHPGGPLFGAQANAKNKCKYDHFTMAGGKVDLQMTCGTMTMTSSGTYTAESTDTEAEIHMDQGIHSKMKAHARCTGACDGTEDRK